MQEAQLFLLIMDLPDKGQGQLQCVVCNGVVHEQNQIKLKAH